MSSSSSSSSAAMTTRITKYDVFLSFRGEDTGDKFTSYLYKALSDKQIRAFIDYKLESGEEISPSLVKVIEQSKFSIIVFSENYASSKCCLEELVKIMECKNIFGQIVIPVFYEVDPSDVRNQTGSFADAFAKHEQRFQESLDTVQTWKDALKKAAELSDLDSRVIKPEYVLVEDIVKFILKQLTDVRPRENKDLVGIDLKIEEIKSLLHMETLLMEQAKSLLIESTHIQRVGIWGIGGIGKTTLAEAVFTKISHHFESSCFIKNVREESEQSGGLNRLQGRLLSGILGDGYVYEDTSSIGRTSVRNRLVLIVFDDVDNIQQIEYLIGSIDHLGLGSRIIITTRNKQVLKNCKVDYIYELQELHHDEALELFCQCAFRQNQSPLDYGQLSNRVVKVVKYCGGVPLALKVLSSFLLDKSKEVWESALTKLKKIPNKNTQKVLQISYHGLDDNEKRIFLDIACFLKGKDEHFVINILNAMGFNAKIGVTVLIDKCLITISNNCITMHDLLQAMGREIVRQESPKYPQKRSRLWHYDDIYNLFSRNKVTEAIEGISLDMSKSKYIHLTHDAFGKMHNLRFLEFYMPLETKNENNVNLSDQGLESVFRKLSYLRWDGCPLTSLQSHIHAENLVALDMPRSNVEQFWNAAQVYPKLIHMNLSHSEFLIGIDLSLVPNIESLIIEGCTRLREISSSSILYLDKLVVLNLTNCKSLKSLPTSIKSNSLKKLVLSGCSNLKTYPQMSCNIEELLLDETAIAELPSSICKLKSLKRIDVSGCSKLDKLPESIGGLESLVEFKAERTAIGVVPSSIGCLKNLETLSFEGCKGQDSPGLVLPSLLGLHELTYLSLTDCGITIIPESLGHLSSIKNLFLGRNSFEHIPANFINLSKLLMLDISYCNKLQVLPELPLTCIVAYSCETLDALSGLSVLDTIVSVDRFITVCFINCFKLGTNELGDIMKDALQRLATLWTSGCHTERYTNTPHDRSRQSYGPRFGICFPGSEIPEWFNFQITACSFTIELEPNWFRNSFVGFAMCAAVAFQDYQDDGRSLCVISKCTFERKDGRGCLLTYGSVYEQYSEDHDCLCHINSEHVFMGFDCFMYPRDLDIERYTNKVSFQFYLRNGKSCEVKRCGVRLVYFGDLGTFGAINLSIDDKAREEPQPKRLKVL